ncbi:hypothetical protein C0993_002697 [Termitomyces sp. T159_Od127]|nr:hypothetical protein C0993_002697 [Termitomyces sp. T159_Od127]
MSAPDLSASSLFNVKGKIDRDFCLVLITGGGSGIGKMIAAGFAQNGAKVYIAARKAQQLKETVEEISRGCPIPVQWIQANVNSKAGCDALIAEFKKRESKLHVLVNNSGITWGGPYNDFPEDKGWDNVFNVNVKAIFYSFRLFPSKMTAFGFQNAGEEAFAAGQPTGAVLVQFWIPLTD